jgi:hypothetical protein
LLRKRGWEHPESYLLEDEGVSMIYEAYHPEKGTDERSPMTTIMLHRPSQAGGEELQEISDAIPDRLKPVTDRGIPFVRYYCPKECREDIRAILRAP